MAQNLIQKYIQAVEGWDREFFRKVYDHVAKGEAIDESIWSDQLNYSRTKPYNCIIDAEICLVFLLSQVLLTGGAFTQEGRNKGLAKEVWDKVKPEAGDDGLVMKSLAKMLVSYFRRHLQDSEENNSKQLFDSTDYLVDDRSAIPDSNSSIETVDAYAFSLTVSIYAKIMGTNLHDSKDKSCPWPEVLELADKRITQSMLGLLYSFSAAPIYTSEGKVKSPQTFENYTGRPWPAVSVPLDGAQFKHNPIDAWRVSATQVSDVRSELIALGYAIDSDPEVPFECGWSWGVVQENADRIVGPSVANAEFGYSSEIFAENAAYLYFTINAIDSIADLTLPIVQEKNILNPAQLEIAGKLARLRSIAVSYWYALATTPAPWAENIDWQVESLPWFTTDRDSSFYFNLYLARIAVEKSNLSPTRLEKLMDLASKFAEVGRVTTRVKYKWQGGQKAVDDQNISDLHLPGKQMPLHGRVGKDGEITKLSEWSVYDFTPQLLKFCGQIFNKLDGDANRLAMQGLIDRIWSQLETRGISRSGGVVWASSPKEWTTGVRSLEDVDEPDAEKSGNPDAMVTSWYFGERVCEGLVAVINARLSIRSGESGFAGLSSTFILELESVLDELELSNDVDRRLNATKLRKRLEDCVAKSKRYPARAFAELITVANMISHASEEASP